MRRHGHDPVKVAAGIVGVQLNLSWRMGHHWMVPNRSIFRGDNMLDTWSPQCSEPHHLQIAATRWLETTPK